VEDNLYVLSPVLVPAWSSSWLVRFNTSILLAQLRIAARIAGQSDPVGVFSIPTAAVLLGRLRFHSTVYYVKDRYAAYYEQMAFSRAGQHDAQLAREADVVIGASYTLFDEHARMRPAAYWVPHGMQNVFLESHGTTDPAALSHVPHPRIVYWGQVNSQVDEALVADLAHRKPAWHFVLVGTRTATFRRLESLQNVHFIPAQSAADLARIGQHADVLMNCRTDSPWNRATCPTKLREYMATGKPVVSRPIEEIAYAFPGMVREALDADEWEEAISDALTEGEDAGRRRIAAVERYDIQAAGERFLSVLLSASHASSHVTVPRVREVAPDETSRP
jgi:glycosyltransferase involved in cell wall biosynthesis